MSGTPELSERKKRILKAVVDAHIRNGEPVGSKFLTQSSEFSCSSATIRNEMAELESMGYLEQPHTSAGRVPSEAGYRFYVDWLIDRYSFNAKEIERLRRTIKSRQAEMRSLLETGAKLASAMTNYTALAVHRKVSAVTASKFELVRLDAFNLVLVIMTSVATVKTRHVKCSFEVSPEACTLLAELLNGAITGVVSGEITMPMVMELERRMGQYDFLVAPVIKAICEELASFDGSELSVEGINKLLSYPEYSDMGRLKELLAMFEEKDDMVRLLDNSVTADGNLHVYIGSENTVKIMDNSTLVLRTVRDGGGAGGAIGIVGPTRMDYSRVISVLDHLSDEISSVMNDTLSPVPGMLPPVSEDYDN